MSYDSEAPIAWIPLRQCTDIPTLEPNSDNEWVWSKLMNCDSEETFGPYHNYDLAPSVGFMYQSFRFEVPEDSSYEFELVNLERVRLERCAESHPSNGEEAELLLADFELSGASLFERTLSAGSWRANLIRPQGPPTPVGLAIRPAE